MDIQDEGYLGDMEEELEGKEFSEEATKIIQDMAAFYISQDQRNDKGKLLASYKSGRFLKTYINIYERAIVGLAETRRSRRPVKIDYGLAYLEDAVAERGELFLVMHKHEVYRLRYLKDVEIIAYFINEQKYRK